MIGHDPFAALTETDMRWLGFVDGLEAWAFVALRDDRELSRDGWPDVLRWLIDEGDALGVDIRGFVGDMLGRVW